MRKLKKQNLLLLFLLIGLFQSSCERKKSVKDTNIPSVEVVYNDVLADQIKLSQLFDHYKFILLKDKGSNQLIGKIDKLIVSKNRIIIYDKSMVNKIFVYDTLGNFVFSLRKGEGPKEVKNIEDFCVNRKKNRLLVLDNGNGAIKIYSLVTGMFLKDVPINHLFSGIVYLNNNSVLLIYSGLKASDKQFALNMEVLKLNHSKIIKSYSLIGNKSDSYLLNTRGYATFLKSKRLIYYSPPFGNKVYMFSKKTGKILKKLSVNFGKKSLSQYSKRIKNANDLSKYTPKSAFITGYRGAVSDRYLIYSVANARFPNVLFVDKNLSGCKSYKHIENDLFNFRITFFVGYSNTGAVYMYLPVGVIKEQKDKNSKLNSFLQKKLGENHKNWSMNPVLVKLWNN